MTRGAVKPFKGMPISLPKRVRGSIGIAKLLPLRSALQWPHLRRSSRIPPSIPNRADSPTRPQESMTGTPGGPPPPPRASSGVSIAAAPRANKPVDCFITGTPIGQHENCRFWPPGGSGP